MSPRQASAHVGHSPDIVERLRVACNGHPHAKIAWPHRVLHEGADEIERLRCALRAVREILRQARCQTDLGWSEQLVSDALQLIADALRESGK